MTRTEQAGKVLRTYALGQRALLNDIAILRAYPALSAADQDQFRASFANWFQLHVRIRELEWIGTDEFIFPRYQKHLKDQGELVANMRERHASLGELEDKIRQAFMRPEGHDEAGLLRSYADILQVYVEHREAIFAPLALEHYDLKEEHAVEVGYRNRLGVSGSSYILPWMLFTATDDERAFLYSRLPLPFRWWCRMRWETWFHKQLPDFAQQPLVVVP